MNKRSGRLSTKTETREKVAVYLDNDSLAALRDISERTVGKPPVAGLIREAVRNFIEEYKKKT